MCLFLRFVSNLRSSYGRLESTPNDTGLDEPCCCCSGCCECAYACCCYDDTCSGNNGNDVQGIGDKGRRPRARRFRCFPIGTRARTRFIREKTHFIQLRNVKRNRSIRRYPAHPDSRIIHETGEKKSIFLALSFRKGASVKGFARHLFFLSKQNCLLRKNKNLIELRGITPYTRCSRAKRRFDENERIVL